MGLRSTLIYTTGAAGSGKSYARCPVFLLKDFLPNRGGVHWSNFPIGPVPENHCVPPHYDGETFRERMARAASKKHEHLEYDKVLERLQVIPPQVMKLWEKGESGPWDFFADRDLAGAHIAIDEIHNFCGRNSKAPLRAQWQAWLGEIRHRGATVEFLTQSPQKVAKEISWEAGVRVQLVAGDDRRDPLLKIPMGDWYELRAKFITGEYTTPILACEQRQVFGFFRRSNVEKIPRDPYYFQFYDSFSAPQQGGSAGQTEKHEHQKRGRIGLLRWFVFRNLWPLTKASAVVLLLAFLFSGQAPKVFVWGIDKFVTAATGDQPDVPTRPVSGSEPARAGLAIAPKTPPVAETQPETHQTDPFEGIEVFKRPEGNTDLPEAMVDAAELEAAMQRIEDIRQQLEHQRTQTQAVETEAADLRKMIGDSSALVLLTQDSVTFRGGFTYTTGQKIDFGPYKGLTIESIDYRRRLVIMDSGDRLRLGRPVGVQPESAPESGPDVPDDLRTTPPDGRGTTPSDRT